MKIAMMVRGYIPAPSPLDIVYAPIPLAVEIAEGLAARGHQVDFYGPAGTRLNVPVKTRGLRSLVHNYSEFQSLLKSVDLLTHYVPSLWDQYLSSEMFKRAAQGKYDMLHFHHVETALSYAGLFPNVPVAYTLHDPIFGWYQELFRLYNSPNQYFISISDNQRLPAPDLPYIATAYNGINLDKFAFSKQSDDYLLFVGRIFQEKGVVEAIDIAKATNHKLIIIGPTYADKHEYFEQGVKPHLGKQIIYLGHLDQEQIVPYYQKAKALLSPIQWEEPFGLTMIEAMACGTPVVAYRRGAVPEIVLHGKTGYIVRDRDEMTTAVGQLDKIDRRACRARVEELFSVDKMVDSYEAAFKSIIKQHKTKKPSSKQLLKKLRNPAWLAAPNKITSKK